MHRWRRFFTTDAATNIKPEAFLTSELQACASSRNLEEGKRIHATIQASDWLRKNKYLANQLMRMYAKCGCVSEARSVFDRVEQKNQHSWNTMLAAYAWNARVREAQEFHDRMPTVDVVSWNALFHAYAQAGHLHHARQIFDHLPQRDEGSWNAVLATLTQSGDIVGASKVFNAMPQASTITCSTMCTAFAQFGHLLLAKELFDAMPVRNLIAWTSILCGFAKEDTAASAKHVFDKMPLRDLVAWNAMAQAYALGGHQQQVKDTFFAMPQRDVISWTSLAVAYAQSGNLHFLEACVSKMPATTVVTWNVLVQAFATNGDIEAVRNTFERMPVKSSISWNIVVAMYADAGLIEEAKDLFDRTPEKDAISWASMVSAYAQNGQLSEAKQTFDAMPWKTIVAWGVMITAYSYVADVLKARDVFDRLPARNIYTWNSMLSTYAHNGFGNRAQQLFWEMIQDGGTKPDGIAFISLLTACNHVGLIDLTLSQFLSMRSDHGVVPLKQHYSALVDLLSRSGRLSDALELLANMPFVPDDMSVGCLLSACTIHCDGLYGAWAAESALGLDPLESSTYVLLKNVRASNILAWIAAAKKEVSTKVHSWDIPMLVIPLGHDYSKESLWLDNLEGHDQVVVDLMKSCDGLGVYLGRLQKEIEGYDDERDIIYHMIFHGKNSNWDGDLNIKIFDSRGQRLVVKSTEDKHAPFEDDPELSFHCEGYASYVGALVVFPNDIRLVCGMFGIANAADILQHKHCNLKTPEALQDILILIDLFYNYPYGSFDEASFRMLNLCMAAGLHEEARAVIRKKIRLDHNDRVVAVQRDEWEASIVLEHFGSKFFHTLVVELLERTLKSQPAEEEYDFERVQTAEQ